MKQAVVALVIKDGLILSITRRHNKSVYGLIGGKVENGETLMQALLREVKEESGITIKSWVCVYQRVEPADSPSGEDFHSYTYYAIQWEGEPTASEEGELAWLTAQELTSTKAAFGDYNTQMLKQFKAMYPDVRLQGE